MGKGSFGASRFQEPVFLESRYVQELAGTLFLGGVESGKPKAEG
ncbi:hypothetical protein [Anaerovibrio sp.]